MQPKQLLGALAGAAFSLALAAPASAGTIYAWRTDDGGYAFADDMRRVPAKYKDRVEVRQSGDLTGHDRYTPQDDAATDRYAAHLEARLERMRKRNNHLAAMLAAPGPPGQDKDGVTVRVGSDGKPVIDIAPGASSAGGPVIIEDVLAKPRGSSQTRTNTVIRRGDEVISVVRPLHDSQRPYPRDEADLDAGDF